MSASDVVIAVLGKSGAGKSTFIHSVTGQHQGWIGKLLKPRTTEIKMARYTHPQTGQSIVFVDTPGIDGVQRSEVMILASIGSWLRDNYGDQKKLSGIIYLHPITDNRLTVKPQERNLGMYSNLLEDGAMNRLVFCTTMWKKTENKAQANREKELEKELKLIVDLDVGLPRFDLSKEVARGIVDIVLQVGGA